MKRKLALSNTPTLLCLGPKPGSHETGTLEEGEGGGGGGGLPARPDLCISVSVCVLTGRVGCPEIIVQAHLPILFTPFSISFCIRFLLRSIATILHTVSYWKKVKSAGSKCTHFFFADLKSTW